MIVAGIDYSMSCPSVCIYDTNTELEFENCKIFFIKKETKWNQTFGNISGVLLKQDWKTDIERFDKISSLIIEILKQHNVEKVCLEGYSMGSSKGLVFNIAEHTAILKYKMFKENISYITPAPSAVKKSFAGKGNAKKDMMHDTLLEREKISVQDILKCDKMNNPTSDVVDSYAMVHYLIKEENAN